MRIYESFEEIDLDHRTLKLERQIAIEELKLSRNQIQEDLEPLNWIESLLKLLLKHGFSVLIVRLFRRL